VLVAETVPESKRVALGGLLFTSAPAGVLLAILASRLFTGEIASIASNPSLSWRFVMGCGALPAFAALLVRSKLKEPDRWQKAKTEPRGSIRELFTAELRRKTGGGVLVCAVALVTFWVFSAFLPMIATYLAEEVAPKGITPAELGAMKASVVTRCMTSFNIGGAIGVLFAAPLALRLGRRPLFVTYFAWSTAGILLAFVPSWTAQTRILLVGIAAASVYGVFASFQFYLPELYPTRLRGTGAGFCLNTGRLLTVAGPFVVGQIAKGGTPVVVVLRHLAWVPAFGFLMLLLGFAAETKKRALGGIGHGRAERHIPAVIGAGNATKALMEGQIV
jgi:MFS family permease